jgi:hypothetical protein
MLIQQASTANEIVKPKTKKNQPDDDNALVASERRLLNLQEQGIPVNLFQPLVNTSFVVLMLARKNPDMVAILVLHQTDMAPEVHTINNHQTTRDRNTESRQPRLASYKHTNTQ